MQKRFADWIWVRIVLASLAMLGTSGSAFGSLLCSAGACRNACGMHEKPKQESKPRSCCDSKADESESKTDPSKTKCECEFQSMPDLAQADLKLAVSVPTFVIDLPEALLDGTGQSVAQDSNRIPSYSDSSPPIAAWHPDFGRAPPAA